MGQKSGEKGAAAVGLQPTIPKSDRLLAMYGFYPLSGQDELNRAPNRSIYK
jgi:hypothetical protein